jgi:hypothetical protein
VPVDVRRAIAVLDDPVTGGDRTRRRPSPQERQRLDAAAPGGADHRPGGSGDPAAREQQSAIIRLLLRHGARPTDENDRGRTVADSATQDWVRALLRG